MCRRWRVEGVCCEECELAGEDVLEMSSFVTEFYYAKNNKGELNRLSIDCMYADFRGNNWPLAEKA